MSTNEIREAINGVVAYLTEHPEDALSTDMVATAVIEEGLRCRAEGPNGAVMISDMVPAVGGGGTAPSPGWLMRAALATCDATVIAMRAAQEGVTLDKLEVVVDSQSDDRGLLGIGDDAPAGPLQVRTQINIAAAGVPAERLQAIIEWAEKHSPVADAIRRAVPVTLEVNYG